MSRGATLSVLGLYNFDSSLFDEMAYPSGFTNEEKQTVVGNILMECAELEFLFPDFNAAKQAIGLWSRLNVAVWERIFTAANLEYNPIENYNRTELETIADDRTDTHSGNDVTRSSGVDSRALTSTKTETHSGSDSKQISSTDAETHSGSDSTQISSTDAETHSGSDSKQLSSTGSETNSGTDTQTNKISGYDSGNLVDHDQNLLQHGHGVSTTSSGSDSTTYGHIINKTGSGSDATTYGHIINKTGSGSDATTYGHVITEGGSGSDATTYGKTETLTHGEQIVHEGDITRNSHISGNIGVTTSQQMLEQEIEISAKLNVMDMIVKAFKERFCILVY